ncbi:uncharacterized protein UTRI_03638 [Ustilago trichophora]|uniref:Uncharacterized protein n=1 Tax=Ustilago trichophora TaxID=86804 RepID=A0A5C3E2Q9_9BASI|nr:uncharacterized protein UTRI_03638 [Ustilago trichophora]
MSPKIKTMQHLPRLVALLLCTILIANQARSLPMAFNRRGFPPEASLQEVGKAAENTVVAFRTIYNDASKVAEDSGVIKNPSPRFVQPQPEPVVFKPEIKHLQDMPAENSRLVRSYGRKSYSV